MPHGACLWNDLGKNEQEKSKDWKATAQRLIYSEELEQLFIKHINRSGLWKRGYGWFYCSSRA